MVRNIINFNTERHAINSKRKYKKYMSTPNYKWTVQGNSLVRKKR